MRRLVRALVSALGLCAAAAMLGIGATAAVAAAADVPFSTGARALKFGTHEIVLTGDGTVANPFNTVGTVTFTPPSGSTQAVTVRAFYDGGNTWRARLYVTETGNWTWTASSATDPGLNGQSGAFTADVSGLPGMLKKDSANPKAWRTDAGQWFIVISDTAWLLFSQDPAVGQNWQQFVSDDAARGITVLGPVGSLGSWGTGDVPHVSDNDPWLQGTSTDRTRYDVSKFQTTESRLIWIFTNFPDMYVQVMLFGTQWQNGWSGLPASVRTNTMDYMIARWSAFPNIFWLVSEDQDLTQSAALAFNREVGNYVATHEPWRHLMSTQPNRDTAFPFTTASDLAWVGYVSLQVSDSLGAVQMSQYATVPVHVMMGEDYYEQDYNGPPSGRSDPRFYYRWSMWSWLLSGGSGNYGGRYGVIHPYSQTGRPDLVWIGPGGVDYTGFQLTGLDSFPYIASYFQARNIDLSVFRPNDSLVTAWGMRSGDAWRPKLMQRGADEFLVYDPNAFSEGTFANVDANRTAQMTLDLTSVSGTLQAEWYRALDGLAAAAAPVQGGGLREMTAPWQGADVVLRLFRSSPVPSAPTDFALR